MFNIELVEMLVKVLDSRVQNLTQLYSEVALSYSRDSAWLVGDFWDEKYDAVDAGTWLV